MEQDYTVKYWKPWENEEGLIRDKYGNYKGTVTFEEYNSEPIDATFKEQPLVGAKKYGKVVPYKTMSGKERLKFQRADKPQEQAPIQAKKDWQPRDDMAIRSQWAIGQSVALFIAHGNSKDLVDMAAIERHARELFTMVNRVKVGDLPKNDEQPEQWMPSDDDLNAALND